MQCSHSCWILVLCKISQVCSGLPASWLVYPLSKTSGSAIGSLNAHLFSYWSAACCQSFIYCTKFTSTLSCLLETCAKAQVSVLDRCATLRDPTTLTFFSISEMLSEHLWRGHPVLRIGGRKAPQPKITNLSPSDTSETLSKDFPLFLGLGIVCALEWRHSNIIVATGRLPSVASIKAFDSHFKRNLNNSNAEAGRGIYSAKQITQCHSVLAIMAAFTALPDMKETVKAFIESVAGSLSSCQTLLWNKTVLVRLV